MTRRVLTAVFLAGVALASALSAAEGPWSAVDAALGRDGKDVPGEARKYGFPRSDLTVVVSGIKLEPALALGSWAAFRKDVKTGHAMTMGDLVLLPAELNPVIRALARGGVAVTAIHNHLSGEQPEVIYVHFGGSGDATSLAAALRAALEKTATPLGAPAAPPLPTAEQQQVFEAVQTAIGRKGSMAGPVLQIGVARKGRIEEAGMEIPPGMGMAIALNFQAIGQQVATTGDFVLTADEVDPVIRALQGNGIDVTALHSHMLRETPRLFFLHFWGAGSPEAIGAGLRAALGHVAVVP
jgi:hypothetical protein